MSARVVVTDTIFPNLAQEEAAARAAEADFEGFQCKTADDVAAAVKDADVAVVQFAPFTEAAAKAVKPGATVIRYGVGYDNIDVKAADAAGLKVGMCPTIAPMKWPITPPRWHYPFCANFRRWMPAFALANGQRSSMPNRSSLLARPCSVSSALARSVRRSFSAFGIWFSCHRF